MDDMNTYNRNQTPTLSSDPARTKLNLLGVKLQTIKK
jgi:hypothetical protein